MTHRLKVPACLLLLLGVLCAVFWRDDIERPGIAIATGSQTDSGTSEPQLVALEKSDTKADRAEVELSAEPQALASVADVTPTQVIRVVDARTGQPLVAATVLHTGPGSYWEDLDAAGRERYSLDTEQFLEELGRSKVSDAEGLVVLPLDAALRIVVGRRDDLYGVGVEQTEEGPWLLRLAPHRRLTVEVYNDQNQPVMGVRVFSEAHPINNPFGMKRRLGTTGEDGVVIHVFELPKSESEAATRLVFAELPGGRYGEFELDPAAPPEGPVRIILPTVGTVTVSVLDPSGAPLDPTFVGDPNIELRAVDHESAEQRAPHANLFRIRQIAQVERDGPARFDNVALDQTFSIHAPTLFGDPIKFSGPTTFELDVIVEHRMHADHPGLAGRLLDTAGQPMRDTRFLIMCRAEGELLCMCAGVTDGIGDFQTYLAESALGARPDEVVFYMALKNMAPSRATNVAIDGALLAVLQVGPVVIPD